MKSIFDNLTNGNLTYAKAKAKRHSFRALDRFAREELGMSSVDANASAAYLKGLIEFQEYCDRTAPAPVVSIHDTRFPSMPHLSNLP